jgi:hypothetical protein
MQYKPIMREKGPSNAEIFKIVEAGGSVEGYNGLRESYDGNGNHTSEIIGGGSKEPKSNNSEYKGKSE